MTQRLRGSVVMLLALMLAVVMIATACSGDEGSTEGTDSSGTPASVSAAPASSAPDGGSGASTIEIGLKDYAIDAFPMSAAAGEVTFTITNVGPGTHELVVLATDTPAADLPVADSTVDEAGMDLIDEAEDIGADATVDLVTDLDAGHYALICNIPGHYELGMYADLVVE